MEYNQIQNAFYGLLETMPLLLDERQRRLFYGCVAYFYGYGGVKLVSERCGVNPRTVSAGIEDLTNPMLKQAGDESVRRAGAGRPSVKKSIRRLWTRWMRFWMETRLETLKKSSCGRI